MFEPTQARLLQAMGYELWTRHAPQAQVIEASPTANSDTPVTPVVDHDPDPLWSALLAAAGLDPRRAEAHGLRRASNGVAFVFRDDELWIDPRGLRADPRAKRTLWKTLRALRRVERGRRG